MACIFNSIRSLATCIITGTLTGWRPRDSTDLVEKAIVRAHCSSIFEPPPPFTSAPILPSSPLRSEIKGRSRFRPSSSMHSGCGTRIDSQRLPAARGARRPRESFAGDRVTDREPRGEIPSILMARAPG